MPSLTITVTPADAQRIQAAGLTAAAIKTELVNYLVSYVESYETGQNAQQFLSTYTPIVPT